MSDIIDQIDALVDDQLAGGEPFTGYDYGDPQYPDCPHCGRKWHGLPVTARIAEMYAKGQFDEDYRVDTDDSQVLCRGSEFIGPMPAEERFGMPGWSLIFPPVLFPRYQGFSYTPGITYIDSSGEALGFPAYEITGPGSFEVTIEQDGL